ncbi:hypothetical protein [Cupriavidus taiwanensis]|uniref:hypothetical protein n=1 Tax=Cupriavidus taiwanensis TaxID=164546 RepID=UPI000E19FB14|nr:hypothetical protein [Cupriavidus taiwanensis]SPA44610.1 hypothetical protein CBM2629_A150412 [Cupriavidus taiwanensis]
MSEDEVKARIAGISALIDAMRACWPSLVDELRAREAELITQLIAQDNPETRGRIKQLRDVIDLPSLLRSEQDGLTAGLAE